MTPAFEVGRCQGEPAFFKAQGLKTRRLNQPDQCRLSSYEVTPSDGFLKV